MGLADEIDKAFRQKPIGTDTHIGAQTDRYEQHRAIYATEIRYNACSSLNNWKPLEPLPPIIEPWEIGYTSYEQMNEPMNGSGIFGIDKRNGKEK